MKLEGKVSCHVVIHPGRELEVLESSPLGATVPRILAAAIRPAESTERKDEMRLVAVRRMELEES